MAYTSIRGLFLGFDPADGNKTVARNGMKSPELKVGPIGSEVSVAGANSVTTPTTAQTITGGGTSIFGGTAAKTYSLGSPTVGVTKRLFCTHVSTIAKTVVSTVDIVTTAQSTIRNIVFTGLGQQITLVGLSTSQYAVVSNSATLT